MNMKLLSTSTPKGNLFRNLEEIRKSYHLCYGRNYGYIVIRNLSSKVPFKEPKKLSKKPKTPPKMAASIQEVNGLRIAVEGCVSPSP